MNNLMRNFSGFDGRIGRQQWWFSAIALTVVGIVLSLILSLVGLGMFGAMGAMSAAATGGDPAAISAAVTDAVHKANWASLIILIIFAYPAAAFSIKRRHDRNSSGMDIWIYLGLTAIVLLLEALGIGMTTVDGPNGLAIPTPSAPLLIVGILIGIFGIYLFVVCGFLKGTVGANQYGPDPLGG